MWALSLIYIRKEETQLGVKPDSGRLISQNEAVRLGEVKGQLKGAG